MIDQEDMLLMNVFLLLVLVMISIDFILLRMLLFEPSLFHHPILQWLLVLLSMVFQQMRGLIDHLSSQLFQSMINYARQIQKASFVVYHRKYIFFH